MRLFRLTTLLLFVFIYGAFAQKRSQPKREVWTVEKANDWYKTMPWLIGSNFLPSTAINQLEMWQADTFDPVTIKRELGWAKSLGMNTMRVYLHDIPFQTDSAGFMKRINIFLHIASRNGIKPVLVIFDSCWDPFPKPGKQPKPTPYVHNSGWVQSPGIIALKDPGQYPRLERYVKGVISRFAKDKRVLAWDLWNEPDNINGNSYGKVDLADKATYVLPLIKKTFEWARSVNPSQPLTSGVWTGNWSSDATLRAVEKVQIGESDIITFHNYGKPEEFANKMKQLERYRRPLICTEYMARPTGSTFEGFLPTAKRHKVGMINWGFVEGKSQTIYPLDSWTKKYNDEPDLWFHDILRKDGTPFKQEEVDLIRSIAKLY